MGECAEMERELSVERVIEGIRKAKLYGTRSGRPPRKIPSSFKKHHEMWKNEEITGVEFARLLDVSRPTLFRCIKEYENA
jgi:DNA invertase Pin-like site-specific DNA recombinase